VRACARRIPAVNPTPTAPAPKLGAAPPPAAVRAILAAAGGFGDPSVYTLTTHRRANPDDPASAVLSDVAGVVLVYDNGGARPSPGETAAELATTRDGADGCAVAAFAFDHRGIALDAPNATRFGFARFDLNRDGFNFAAALATNARVSQAWRADRASLRALAFDGVKHPFPSREWVYAGPLSVVAMPYQLGAASTAAGLAL